MKKLVMLETIIMVLFAVNLYSCKEETPKLICVEQDNKWGYVDLQGKERIPFEFSYATPFADNGLALVKKEGKCGYIDKYGKFKIEAQYYAATPFVDGVAVVVEGASAPLIINSSGIILKELTEAEEVKIFSEGRALFRNHEGKYGFVNSKGSVVINPTFEYATSFNEGFATVADSSGSYIINNVGKIVTRIQPVWKYEPDDVSGFSDGLVRVRKVGGGYGFINKKGEIVIDLQFDSYDFKEGLARVTVGDQFGFIDKKGQLVINPQYDGAGCFSSGLCIVKVGGDYGYWGYIDKKNQMVISPQFNRESSDFIGEIAAVRIASGWGVIDKKGSYLVNPTMDKIILSNNDIDRDYKTIESNYFDVDAVVDSFISQISTDSFFGVKPGDGIETLPIGEGKFVQKRNYPNRVYSFNKNRILNGVTMSQVEYSFEEGEGLRPAIFPEETGPQPWVSSEINTVRFNYELSGKAFDKAELISDLIAKELEKSVLSVEKDDTNKEYVVIVPVEDGSVQIKLKYDDISFLPVIISFPRVVKMTAIGGNTLPDQYAWIVKGGDWMDNPFQTDSDSYTFHNDKTYNYYSLQTDSRYKGKFEIVNGTKMLLRDSDGKVVSMDLDLEEERIACGGEWLFASEGTKYNELMCQRFTPGFTGMGNGYYYHNNWSKNGVFVRFNNGDNNQVASATFKQFPVNEEYETISVVMSRAPINELTLTIKNGNQFVDKQGKVVATGHDCWPYDVIEITGKDNAWYMGRYGTE